MTDNLNPAGAGGTTSAQGADPGRAERAKAFYQQHPPISTGTPPAGAITLGSTDDAATATARAMGVASPADADVLIEAGATWQRVRQGIDDPLTRGEALDETVGLIETLRADARKQDERAKHLEVEAWEDLGLTIDVDGEERRVLFDAITKLPPATVGDVLVKLASKLATGLQDYEGRRLTAITRLIRAGALPDVPQHQIDQANELIVSAQSDRRAAVDAARNRSRLLGSMATTIERTALGLAEKRGALGELRSRLGLDELIEAGERDPRAPLAPAALVLDVPTDDATRRAWGRK
jgi:hypothetical protein